MPDERIDSKREISISFGAGYVSFEKLMEAVEKFQAERTSDDIATATVKQRTTDSAIYTTITFTSREA